MPQTKFSVQMDTEVKKQFDEFCRQVGMNTSTAINMFARAVLREKRLPFEVTTEPSIDLDDNNDAVNDADDDADDETDDEPIVPIRSELYINKKRK
jgi:DNA-damage-inducible protein J